MAKPLKLSSRQVLLLCVLLPRPISPRDAAFQMCSSPSGATRTMNALCVKGLAYWDDPNTGAGSYCWTVTPEGVKWIRGNRVRVEEVHLDLGFTLEDVASIYTGQIG